MIGLVITVHNRPDYTKKCLESLAKCDLSNVIVCVVDDYSTNRRIPAIINNHNLNCDEYKVINSQRNYGVASSLEIGFRYCIRAGCNILCNLDNDSIVSKNFLDVTSYLLSIYNNRIITGFNTYVENEKGLKRHPIYKEHTDHVEKYSCGGINTMFTKATYAKYVHGALKRSRSKRSNWDVYVTRAMAKDGLYAVCSKPSVVEHIGDVSTFKKRVNPDKSCDFILDGNDIVEVKKDKKKALILQSFGLGDVIFSQSIANHYMSIGYEITWPVKPIFLDQVKSAYPKINWIPEGRTPVNMRTKAMGERNGYHVLPIRFSDTIMRVPYKEVMKAKYYMVGLDWQTWRDHAMWVRAEEKENSLIEELGAKGDYCLVNSNFTTKNKRRDVKPKTDLPIIEMDYLDGYSLFDWAKVIENAKEIHTVSTSIIYMMEMLKLRCAPHIYVRRPIESNHDFYSYILQKNQYVLE